MLGAIAAGAVWLTDLEWSPASARLGLLALPLLLGLALYFRSHWAATARSLRSHRLAGRDAGQRIERLADDLERSAWVIADNLDEVGAAGRAELFLDGARAHARKLPDLAQRARGIADRIRGGGATPEEDPDED